MTIGKTRFLAQHPQTGTKSKPASPHLLQCSPYYWWWAYLKRNADYLACCDRDGKGKLAKLYGDFGDVRGDDFRAWWGGNEKRGAKLFGEMQVELRLKQLASKAEWESQWGSDVVVVAVNLQEGRRRLQKDFADLLAAIHQGKRGRKALGKVASTAKYPLHRNFSQHNLRLMLQAYDAWVSNEALPKAERQPMWAIGESFKLVPTAMPEKGDTKYITTNKHNVMTVAVSRYIKQAKAIVANTAKGQFPNSEP